MTTPHPLWLTEHFYPGAGGMAASCDRIVQGLRDRGVAVDVAHLSRRATGLAIAPKQHGRDISCGIGVDPAHDLNLLWNALANDPARGALTQVVAFGGQFPLLAGPSFAAWLGVPLITLLRGNDLDIGLFTPGREAILHTALARSACIGVVSRDHERKVRALYPQATIAHIANGIDAEEWDALPSQRAAAAAWRVEQVAPGRRVLGLIGQIKAKKGGRLLLEALLASGQADRFHLLLIGEIDEASREWLAAYGSTIAHTILPFVARPLLPPYYLACDLIALPSLYDGLPNVLLEAAALGVPFVASTAGGISDVLRDEEHGFLFPPGDAGGCRAAIVRAAEATDATLARQGAACAATVRAEYTADREAAAYHALLHDAGC